MRLSFLEIASPKCFERTSHENHVEKNLQTAARRGFGSPGQSDRIVSNQYSGGLITINLINRTVETVSVQDTVLVDRVVL